MPKGSAVIGGEVFRILLPKNTSFYSIVLSYLFNIPIFHKIFSEITFLPTDLFSRRFFVQEGNPKWSNMAIGEI
jgi:hypothetical protein